MKIKIKRYDMLFIEEEKCLNQLSSFASEGWILKAVKLSSFIFIKDKPQKLKYQVDYHQYSDEYKEFITAMGYTFIDNYKNITIFSTEDLEASNLHTDETVKYLVLKKSYKIYSALLSLFVSMICLSILISSDLLNLSFSIRMTWGNLILNYKLFILMYLLVIFLINCILKASGSLLIRWHEQRKVSMGNFQWLSRLIKLIFEVKAKLTSIILIILIPLLLELLLVQPVIWIIILISSLIGYLYELYRRKMKKKSQDINKILGKISLCFPIIIIFVIQIEPYLFPEVYKSEFQTAQFVSGDSDRSLLYTEHWIEGMENDFNLTPVFLEDYYKCFNTWTANEIFKELIVQVKHESMYPSQEEYEQLESFNSMDVMYLSYSEAIKEFKVYSSELVDKCYCLDSYIVAIKDNKVFKGKLISDHLIDEVLDYYFNF